MKASSGDFRPREAFMLAHALDLPIRTDKWSAWDHFVEQNPTSGFMQTSWWAQFHSTPGGPHFGVVVRRQGFVLGGGMIQCHPWGPGSFYYHLPDGPVLPTDPTLAEDVLSVLFSTMQERRRRERRRVTHLRFEPRWEEIPATVDALGLVHASPGEGTVPRQAVVVELRTSETAILAEMPVEDRANIAWARSQGLGVVEDSSDAGIAGFASLMAGHDGVPSEALFRLLHSQGRGSLHFVEYRGERLGAGLLVTFGPRATFLAGMISPGRWTALSAPLLHFELMRRAKRLRCRWYEVPRPEGGAILGGTLLTFVPAFDLVLDGAGYAEYIATRAALLEAPSR